MCCLIHLGQQTAVCRSCRPCSDVGAEGARLASPASTLLERTSQALAYQHYTHKDPVHPQELTNQALLPPTSPSSSSPSSSTQLPRLPFRHYSS